MDRPVTTRDYNGPGEWGADAIAERYLRLARIMKVRSPLSLAPRRGQSGDREWIYPIIEEVFLGAEAGDPACIELTAQFAESGHRQAFGRSLKAKAARILGRVPLTVGQAKRLRRRALDLLDRSEVCWELCEMAKLLRKLGLPPDWRSLCRRADMDHPSIRRQIERLEKHGRVCSETRA